VLREYSEEACQWFHNQHTRTFYRQLADPFKQSQIAILATTRLALPLRRLCTTTVTRRILVSTYPQLRSRPARNRVWVATASRNYHCTSFQRFSSTHTMSDTGVHNLGRYGSQIVNDSLSLTNCDFFFLANQNSRRPSLTREMPSSFSTASLLGAVLAKSLRPR